VYLTQSIPAQATDVNLNIGMAILRPRTLSPNDPACYIIQTGVSTFLTETNHYAGLDAARLFTKDAAQYAIRDAYRAMVNYVALSVVYLPDSPYKKFFYA
jgi:hypothetical protein